MMKRELQSSSRDKLVKVMSKSVSSQFVKRVMMRICIKVDDENLYK